MSHKYVSKEWKNGHWHYVYPEDKVKQAQRTYSNSGDGTNLNDKYIAKVGIMKALGTLSHPDKKAQRAYKVKKSNQMALTGQSLYGRSGSETTRDKIHFYNEATKRYRQAAWDDKRVTSKIRSEMRRDAKMYDHLINKTAHLRTAAGMKQQKSINQQKLDAVKADNKQPISGIQKTSSAINARGRKQNNYIVRRKATGQPLSSIKKNIKTKDPIETNAEYFLRDIAARKQSEAKPSVWEKKRKVKFKYSPNKAVAKVRSAYNSAKKNVNSAAAKGKARLSKLIGKK